MSKDTFRKKIFTLMTHLTPFDPDRRENFGVGTTFVGRITSAETISCDTVRRRL